MRWKIKIIFTIMTHKAKKSLCKSYGAEFYKKFKKKSRSFLDDILKDVPDIGKSIFSLNYNYGPCYFSWYKALMEQDISKEEAIKIIWQINEAYVKTIPKPVLHVFARNIYLGGFRKKAAEAEKRERKEPCIPLTGVLGIKT